jgi:hypothetical protein
MNALWVAALLVAPLSMQAPDPEDVKPGLLGLSLFVFLAVATVLLWLSMRRQLKKVDFEEAPDPGPAAEPEPQPEPPRG